MDDVSGSTRYHLGDKWKRTHHCGSLRRSDDGAEIIIAGWVKRVRELGYLTFPFFRILFHFFSSQLLPGCQFIGWVSYHAGKISHQKNHFVT